MLGLAAALALAGLVVRFSWTLHGLYNPIPALGNTKFLWLFMSKGDLGPLPFANVLALAVLVRRLISPQASFLAGRVAWPFVTCGRHSLHIFCLGILLSVVGHLVLSEFFGGRLMQLAVSAVGMAIMIAVAALMDWFAARGRYGRPGSRARLDGGGRVMIASLAPRGWMVALIATVSLALLPAPRAGRRAGGVLPNPRGFRGVRGIATEDREGARAWLRRPDRHPRRVLDASAPRRVGSTCPGLRGWPWSSPADFPRPGSRSSTSRRRDRPHREAAGRLAREVLPLKPKLLIWETGTVEAVRGTDVDEFRETVQGGVDELHAAGIEVVLMSAQFSRDADAMINFEPYLGAMREVADVNQVTVFNRYGLMRHWVGERGAGPADEGQRQAPPARHPALRLPRPCRVVAGCCF